MPLLVFKKPAAKGREGKREGRKGKREGRYRGGGRRDFAYPKILAWRPYGLAMAVARWGPGVQGIPIQ